MGTGGRLSQTIFEARSRNSEEPRTHRNAGGGKGKINGTNLSWRSHKNCEAIFLTFTLMELLLVIGTMLVSQPGGFF